MNNNSENEKEQMKDLLTKVVHLLDSVSAEPIGSFKRKTVLKKIIQIINSKEQLLLSGIQHIPEIQQMFQLDIAPFIFSTGMAPHFSMIRSSESYFASLLGQRNFQVDEMSWILSPGCKRHKGTLVVEFYKSGKCRTLSYHIKTDLHGGIFSGNVISTDIRELFVYKVFEHLGIGPKCYFYSPPGHQDISFIATRDVTASKKPRKQKKFCSFDKYGMGYAHDRVEQFLILDIIKHIFELDDMFADPTKFGTVYSPVQSKWIILSLHCNFPERPNDHIFDCWYSGQTKRYPAQLLQVTDTQDPYRKIERARVALITLQRGLERISKPGCRRGGLDQAILQAHKDIVNAVEVDLPGLRSALPKLVSYKHIILKNLKTLAARINSDEWDAMYKPDPLRNYLRSVRKAI